MMRLVGSSRTCGRRSASATVTSCRRRTPATAAVPALTAQRPHHRARAHAPNEAAELHPLNYTGVSVEDARLGFAVEADADVSTVDFRYDPSPDPEAAGQWASAPTRRSDTHQPRRDAFGGWTVGWHCHL